MALEQATALVLRVVEWSESSSIITAFTREFGRVRGVAKGARRPKGAFDSALDHLALCKVVFLRKVSDALDIFTEAKLLRSFRPRVRGLAATYAAYYVAELLADLCDDYDPHPALFDAANAALERLGSAVLGAAPGDLPPRLPPPWAETLRFELTALRELGYLPSLEECVECGQPIVATQAQGRDGPRVTFGQLAGGVLCARCRPGKRQVVSLSQQAWETLVVFSADSSQWQFWPAAPAARSELRGMLNHYLANLAGHPLRLSGFLEP